jgi:hypothetical protein
MTLRYGQGRQPENANHKTTRPPVQVRARVVPVPRAGIFHRIVGGQSNAGTIFSRVDAKKRSPQGAQLSCENAFTVAHFLLELTGKPAERLARRKT